MYPIDLTHLLDRAGDRSARDLVFDRVQDELRLLARRPPSRWSGDEPRNTIAQAHEAWLGRGRAPRGGVDVPAIPGEEPDGPGAVAPLHSTSSSPSSPKSCIAPA